MLEKLRKLNLISISRILVLCACFFGIYVPIVFGYVSPGNPTGFVNDFSQTLTSEQVQSLNSKLTSYRDSTGNEVAIAIIKNLGGDSVENYANSLFRQWGIGSKETNRGVLILVSIEDRKMRIEVGYGLEPYLTDLQSYRIDTEAISPYFKNAQYYEGLNTGVDSILSVLGGSELPAHTTGKDLRWYGQIMQVAFVFLLFGSQIIFATLAPTKSWWLGGIFGGIVGVVFNFLYGTLVNQGVIIGAFIALGLLIDFLVSRSYKNRGNSRNDFWSGPWIGGGSGGGSSGGFGGFGGGSSGGGGSSSSW